MRVSTGMLYESGTRAMVEGESNLLHTQRQLSSGRRITAPSDDPVASSQALGVTQARDVTSQYAENVAQARASLSLTESTLGDVTDILQSARQVLVQAGNPTLSDADRRALAMDLRAREDELVAAANRGDGQGRYLFAGYREQAAPFAAGPSGVAYSGDQGVRALQVSAGRTLAIGANGAQVFQSIPSGNGVFVTAVAPANAGDGSITTGSVTDASSLTGHTYAIDFSAASGTTTYTVTDTTTNTVLSSGTAYQAGSAVVFGGLEVAVRGTPQAGDRFTVAPQTPQDLFDPLRDAIAALETPLDSPVAKASFATTREQALAGLDLGIERVLAVRSQMGASLRELDGLDATHANTALAQDSEISRLTDLDYAQAISDFAREQQALQAAQKAFQGTAQLSLFAMLP